MSDQGDGEFKPVGESEERMFGPRGILACGFAPEDQARILSLLAGDAYPEVGAIFVGEDDLDLPLAAALAFPDRHGYGETSEAARAVVLSGFSERELHAFMKAYRAAGLPRPLWATLTPHSQAWSVRALVKELAEERAEIEAARQARAKQ